MIQKNFWTIFILVAVVLVGAAVLYGKNISKQANEGVVITEHIKGNKEATITLTEYSDFQCPACASFTEVVDEVLAEYGNDIRFEYKHFPLISIHPQAVAGGIAAEAAGQQGKFFEMHDKLFENQKTWSTSPNPQTFFNQYAEEIGLDVDQFKRQYKSSVLRDQVMSGYNEARELGLTGTPSFFLNGQRMSFETYQDFLDAIAEAVNGGPVIDGDMSTSSATELNDEVQFAL